MRGERCTVELAAEHSVQISNPDKLLWPSEGLTKAHLLDYFVHMSPYLLQHLTGRALTTIRCPDGVDKHQFFQKDAPLPTPDWVTTVDVPSVKKDKLLKMVVVDSLATLLWLGNLACIEFHVGFDRVDVPDQPTWIALDLDPTVPGFERVRTVAVCIHELFNHLEVPHTAKTSGATGLQIFVPIVPRVNYDETRLFTQAVAQYVVSKHPSVATIERLTKNRGSKVYIDYIQHGARRTLIAPYSPRANTKAMVSTPITAEELTGTVTPADFTIQSVPRRVQHLGDLLVRDEPYDIRPITKFLQRHPQRV